MDFMLPEISLELTLEQKFQMRLIEEQVAIMTHQQPRSLQKQLCGLLMIKDNVIRSLVKKEQV